MKVTRMSSIAILKSIQFAAMALVEKDDSGVAFGFNAP